jgi:hypothetical protein
MPRPKSYTLIPTPEQFAERFLAEVLAAAAGVEVGERPIAELGEFAADERHCDAHDALWAYFRSLEPYRRFGDFQGLETMPRPRPLQLHIAPHILHGHFRAWLRKQGIDPDKAGYSAH